MDKDLISRIEELEKGFVLIDQALRELASHAHMRLDYTYVEDFGEFVYKNYRHIKED